MESPVLQHYLRLHSTIPYSPFHPWDPFPSRLFLDNIPFLFQKYLLHPDIGLTFRSIPKSTYLMDAHILPIHKYRSPEYTGKTNMATCLHEFDCMKTVLLDFHYAKKQNMGILLIGYMFLLCYYHNNITLLILNPFLLYSFSNL